jgi:hypothetical protein
MWKVAAAVAPTIVVIGVAAFGLLAHHGGPQAAAGGTTPALGAAAGAREDVFGIALGQPLQLPECPAGAEATAVCVKAKPAPDYAFGGRGWSVVFPAGAAPSILGGELSITTIEGRVEHVDFTVRGTPQEVLAQLSRKYGEPTTAGDFGAQWSLPGLTVNYGSASAALAVATERYDSTYRAWSQRQLARQHF